MGIFLYTDRLAEHQNTTLCAAITAARSRIAVVRLYAHYRDFCRCRADASDWAG